MSEIKLSSEDSNLIRFIQDFESENKILRQLIALSVYCERELDDLIKSKCKNPARPLKWTYSNKVDLLYSIEGIPEWMDHNLKQLGNARNHFAHNINASFSNLKQPSLKAIRNNKTVTISLSKYNEERAVYLIFIHTYLPLTSVIKGTPVTIHAK